VPIDDVTFDDLAALDRLQQSNRRFQGALRVALTPEAFKELGRDLLLAFPRNRELIVPLEDAADIAEWLSHAVLSAGDRIVEDDE
jgi:hypothetical protein